MGARAENKVHVHLKIIIAASSNTSEKNLFLTLIDMKVRDHELTIKYKVKECPTSVSTLTSVIQGVSE